MEENEPRRVSLVIEDELLEEDEELWVDDAEDDHAGWFCVSTDPFPCPATGCTFVAIFMTAAHLVLVWQERDDPNLLWHAQRAMDAAWTAPSFGKGPAPRDIVRVLAHDLALNRGRPGMAAVDVFEAEPILQGHLLLRLENAVCTPHIGYVEQDSYELYFRTAFENVVNFVEGRPTNIVNPEALKVRH